MLRRYQWWTLLLLNLIVIHKRSNWLCWKAQEKFQVESRFCKTIGCSYVTLLTTYLAKKTMFKVSNRNTRKRCLLISKITLKHQDNVTWLLAIWGRLLSRTMSWTVFPRIYTNLQLKVCFQFCFQVRRPVISTIVNPFMSFYEKLLPKYLIHENSKYQHFFISEKTAPTFYLIFKGSPFQYHNVRHPNFL